jgi:hypothetical protein
MKIGNMPILIIDKKPGKFHGTIPNSVINPKGSGADRS